jgi:hypothetical protein
MIDAWHTPVKMPPQYILQFSLLIYGIPNPLIFVSSIVIDDVLRRD